MHSRAGQQYMWTTLLEWGIEADMAEARRICVDLLGSTSGVDDKTELGVCLDVIGYTINLTDKRVFIAKEIFLKALNGYISKRHDEMD
jgi:hypothetical protein